MATLLKFLLPALVFGVAIAGYLKLESTAPVASPAPAEERVWTVTTAPITYGDVQPEIEAFGSVVAGRTAELRPHVAGPIAKTATKFVEGAEVAAGDLLVTIDPFNYQSAVAEARAAQMGANARLRELQSQLAAEQTMIETARRQRDLRSDDVARRRRLVERGAGAEKTVDDAVMLENEARMAVEMAEQTISSLEAQITQQKASIDRASVTLAQAERDLADTRLTAPFDGYLANVDAAIGMQASPQDRLARLIDRSRLEARFELPNAIFARLVDSGDLIGRPVSVRWRVGGRDFMFHGEILRVDSQIDSMSGGVGLFASIKTSTSPQSDAPLRPGAFVAVTFADVRFRDAARLPAGAVGDDGAMFVVKDDRLVRYEAEVLRRVGDSVILRSDAPDGALAVTDRFPEIGPGMKVRPVDANGGDVGGGGGARTGEASANDGDIASAASSGASNAGSTR